MRYGSLVAANAGGVPTDSPQLRLGLVDGGQALGTLREKEIFSAMSAGWRGSLGNKESHANEIEWGVNKPLLTLF